MDKRICKGIALLTLLLVLAIIARQLYPDQQTSAETSSWAYVVHTSGNLAGINVDKELFTLTNVSGAGAEDGNTYEGTMTFSCWGSLLFQELRDVVPLGTRITVTHSPSKDISTSGEVMCAGFTFETENGLYNSQDMATKHVLRPTS